MSFDFSGWLQRIGYHTAPRPTLETLQNLITCQSQTITFENIDVLLGRPIALDVETLNQKLIAGGRGGYCFELNGVMSQGLQAIGYDIHHLSGRVLVGHPPTLPPRTHRMMWLPLNGERWLVDVGFGGQTPLSPLRLVVDEVQQAANGRYRLVIVDDDYQLEMEAPRGWQPLYRFDFQEQYPADYHMANYYIAHSPDSHFTHSLMLSLPTTNGRYTLFNRHFTYHGSSDSRRVLDDDALYSALDTHFNLRLNDPLYGITQEELVTLLHRLDATHHRKKNHDE